ncbi:MAG: putative secreted protein [Labilithrix sp.]|nr:putative secreted protein [Labilithrix sp.]
MSLRRFLAQSVLASTFVAACAVGAAGCAAETGDDNTDDNTAAATQARPPQFVMLAFDGSYNNAFWQESRTFAKNNSLKFTYFVNSVYYVARPNNASYKAPRHNTGLSNIGWGDSSPDIKTRLENTKAAYAEGNEIGSHTAGHFDGTGWTEAEWEQEFASFEKMFWSAPKTAGFPTFDLGFTNDEIKGFRAPQLGTSPGLYKVLAKRGFTYDTSKTATPNHWPTKEGGVWNFPLAQLRIVGTGKSTLSMDYNFFFADSKGVNDKNTANYAAYEKHMVDTYMQYFQSNYFGNRAPVHIGHHFSKWNGSAYWNAMQTVAKRVCGLPEVKCVTYGELAKFTEANASKIADYQAGNFPKMAKPPSSGNEELEAVQPIDPSELPPAEGHEAHDDAPQDDE